MGKITEFDNRNRSVVEHDPVECNLTLAQETKIYSAVNDISKIVEEKDLTYSDFLVVVSMLSHFYDNFFEINEFDVTDEDDMENVYLPSVSDTFDML